MKKAFCWVVSSLEDEHGQASYKRIGIAIFLFLIGYMVLTKMIITVIWENVFFSLEVTASVWVGLVTIPQILMFFGRDKGGKTDDPEPKPEITQKIEGEVTLTPKPDESK